MFSSVKRREWFSKPLPALPAPPHGCLCVSEGTVLASASQADVLMCPWAPTEGGQACFLHPLELWLLAWIPSSADQPSCILGKIGRSRPGRWHGPLVAVKEATTGASAEGLLQQPCAVGAPVPGGQGMFS